MNTNTLPHFTRFGALMTLLLLPAVNHADEVPLQSFEWDPMNPALWVPGSINNEEWLVQPGTGTVAVTETDAHSGAQSILFSRGLPGTQARLDLQGHLPLAEILPAFVDCWVRPASFSTYSAGTYAPPNAASGTQIFVDGHWFCFLSQTAGGPLRLHYHNQLAEGNPWVMSFSPAASIPLMETPPSPNDVVAADWVRFTCRVDPATQRADVWLNGRLVFTDVPRSDAYASFPAPSFYMQGSSHGPQGFDDFQSALTNPLFGDMDADGLPDDWEQEHSLNVSVNDRAADPDGDGLNSLEEFKLRTRPDEDDTDADGIPDGWEIAEGLNPLHDRDAWQDFDLDGADNLTEYLEDTDPNERLQSTVSSIYVRAVDPAVGVWWSGEVGTWDEPFSDLAGALALLHNLPQSSSGPVPTIVILPDSYSLQGAGNTNLTISRDVNIQGNGAWMEGVDTETYYPAHWGFNIQHASVTFESFSFYGCWGPAGSAVYAAGYYRPDMKLVMRNCWFYYCGAVDNGGAIRLFHVPSATFENCGWDSCYANDKGGAFSAEASAVNIQRSRFYWNYATGDGGGLHLKGSTGLIENCLFDGNTSGADGGAAVFKNGTDAALRYVTAVGNGATGQGAAFYNSSSNALPITGSILWGNGISPIASNTQATGLWSVRYTTAQQQLFSGPGNSVSDPLLVEWLSTLKPGSPAIDAGDPAAPPAKDCDGNPRKHAPGYSGTSRADRGCFEFSDADGDGLPDSWEAMYGLNAAIPNRDSDYDQDGFTDYEEYLAGTAPIYSGYRPPGAVFYVHPLSGNDANNGSFSAPVKTISRAIALCNNTTTARICLRDGTYTGSLNKNLTTNPGGVAKKFYLRSINGKGRVTIDLQDSGRFLIIENPAWDGTCGLEGLTIRRGKVWYQSNMPDSTVGAGILVRNTSAASQPFIARCTFSGCEAFVAGGAIYVGNGSLFLFETELFANRAYYGGALSIQSLSGTHTVFGLNCTLAYNWAPDGGGGAISSYGRMQWKGGAIFSNTAAWGGAVALEGATNSSTAFSSGTGAACRHSLGWPGGTAFWQSQFSAYSRPLMSGTRIADNDAWSHGEPELPRGGAISIVETPGEPAFESLVLENNRAAGENYNNDGGAVCSIFSSPSFTACIFRGNQTVSRGGAIYAESIDANGEPTALANCALCENEAASEGGAIAASPWTEGRHFIIHHSTITRNTSPWHVISTADGDEYWPGNWAELRHCLLYYNRTPNGGVSPVAPSTLAGTTYPNAIENPAGNTTNNGPALAWDGYHLVNPSSIPDPALPPPTGTTRDIDSELRVSGNPAEYGCDEWTDSNGDGIPDWYVQMLMRLFPNAGITLMTDNLASRLLWGPDGPSIRQVYDYGLNPGRSPLLNDADGDGITDAREILELNTSPTNIGSSPGLNLTDAQKAGEGAEVDSDKDGAMDDDEALPLDNDFRWPKAPEYQYVAIPLGENTKALGVTPEGKILIAARNGTGPYTWTLHIVDQASPLPLGPALPPSETTNRTGFANSQWPQLISRTTGFPRLAGGQPLVLDRFLDSTSQTSDYRTAVYSSNLAWVNTAITVGPAISFPPARPAGLGPPALPQQGALPEWLTSDSHLMGVAPLQFPIINASQSISSPPTASGFMLVRWELTGAPPIEFTGLYEPAPLPCYTHGYSPFFDNNGAQSGTAAVCIYRDVSEIGNVLYQPGTETLHPPQYLYRRATGTREAVSQPQFHTVDARSIHELPAPAPSDTAFIKGPVLAGAEPESNLDTLWLWEERQAPFNGLIPKRLPVYSGTEKTYLQVSDVRDISDSGEMIVGFEQIPSSDTRQVYSSIWRNGRSISMEDLTHLEGYVTPLWQGVGYGKNGVMVANVSQSPNPDNLPVPPMQATVLMPLSITTYPVASEIDAFKTCVDDNGVLLAVCIYAPDPITGDFVPCLDETIVEWLPQPGHQLPGRLHASRPSTGNSTTGQVTLETTTRNGVASVWLAVTNEDAMAGIRFDYTCKIKHLVASGIGADAQINYLRPIILRPIKAVPGVPAQIEVTREDKPYYDEPDARYVATATIKDARGVLVEDGTEVSYEFGRDGTMLVSPERDGEQITEWTTKNGKVTFVAIKDEGLEEEQLIIRTAEAECIHVIKPTPFEFELTHGDAPVVSGNAVDVSTPLGVEGSAITLEATIHRKHHAPPDPFELHHPVSWYSSNGKTRVPNPSQQPMPGGFTRVVDGKAELVIDLMHATDSMADIQKEMEQLLHEAVLQDPDYDPDGDPPEELSELHKVYHELRKQLKRVHGATSFHSGSFIGITIGTQTVEIEIPIIESGGQLRVFMPVRTILADQVASLWAQNDDLPPVPFDTNLSASFSLGGDPNDGPPLEQKATRYSPLIIKGRGRLNGQNETVMIVINGDHVKLENSTRTQCTEVNPGHYTAVLDEFGFGLLFVVSAGGAAEDALEEFSITVTQSSGEAKTVRAVTVGRQLMESIVELNLCLRRSMIGRLFSELTGLSDISGFLRTASVYMDTRRDIDAALIAKFVGNLTVNSAIGAVVGGPAIKLAKLLKEHSGPYLRRFIRSIKRVVGEGEKFEGLILPKSLVDKPYRKDTILFVGGGGHRQSHLDALAGVANPDTLWKGLADARVRLGDSAQLLSGGQLTANMLVRATKEHQPLLTSLLSASPDDLSKALSGMARYASRQKVKEAGPRALDGLFKGLKSETLKTHTNNGGDIRMLHDLETLLKDFAPNDAKFSERTSDLAKKLSDQNMNDPKKVVGTALELRIAARDAEFLRGGKIGHEFGKDRGQDFTKYGIDIDVATKTRLYNCKASAGGMAKKIRQVSRETHLTKENVMNYIEKQANVIREEFPDNPTLVFAFAKQPLVDNLNADVAKLSIIRESIHALKIKGFNVEMEIIDL